MVGDLLRELKQAIRALVRAPGYATITAATLAVGIGWTTAVFSVVSAVLVDPLGYPDPEELVVVGGQLPGLGSQDLTASAPEYRDYLEASETLEDLAATWILDVNVTGLDQPFRSRDAVVTVNFFSMIGVEPVMGRDFTPEDAGGDIGNTAILSYAGWQRYFGADPNVIGRTFLIDDDPIEVIGVMPAGFEHPEAGTGDPVAIWGPIDVSEESRFGQGRNARNWTLFGRLADGVSREVAQSEFEAIASSLRQTYPDAYPAETRWTTSVVSLKERIVGPVRLSLMLVLGAAGFVLLIACSNVANLMLARGSERTRSIALRGALGASRMEQARGLILEGLAISVLGGALGIAIAAMGTRVVRAGSAAQLPRLQGVGVDGTVLGFSALLTIGTALIVASIPAVRLTRLNLQDVLRQGSRAGSNNRRAQNTLVVVEIAFSILLLVGSGLTLKSYGSLMSVDLGFEPDQVMTMRTYLPWTINPTDGRYFDQDVRIGFYDQALQRIEEAPNVVSAGLVTRLPLRRLNGTNFSLLGADFETSTLATNAEFRQISPSYFDVMGIPLVEGRTLVFEDLAEGEFATIVNEAWVDRYSPEASPIGREIRIGSNPNAPVRSIVGVVGNVKQHGLDAAPRETIYASYRQGVGIDVAWVIQTRGLPEGVTALAVDAINSLDPTLPIFLRESMSSVVAGTVSRQRLVTNLLSLFAIQAALLAALGVYGVMSQAVGQRRREIGIRMAIGAERGSVIRLVVSKGTRLGAAGVVVGLVLAAFASRTLQSILYQVEPLDLTVYGLVAVLALGLAALSSLLPAWSAARTDPAGVIKGDD
jgi:predicted permease